MRLTEIAAQVADELGIADRAWQVEYIMEKHANQVDKQGHDYFTAHLVPVAKLVHPYIRLCALAHDILEDTDAQPQNLRNMGFTNAEVDIIMRLTKRTGEALEHYTDRIKHNRNATSIKMADVVSNLSRLTNLPLDTQERLKVKYFRTLIYLVEP